MLCIPLFVVQGLILRLETLLFPIFIKITYIKAILFTSFGISDDLLVQSLFSEIEFIIRVQV